jgi:hypothetical protein
MKIIWASLIILLLHASVQAADKIRDSPRGPLLHPFGTEKGLL